MATTTVVVRRLTNGTEAERILDALDAAIDLPSDRLSNGARRYGISERQRITRDAAVEMLTAELDRISATWPIHVAVDALS